MKRIYFSIFALALCSACNTEPAPQDADTDDNIATDTAATTAAATDSAVDTIAIPASDWADFWAKFKVAVGNRQDQEVAKLTLFPLRGSEAWDETGKSKLGPDHLTAHFDEIFDPEVRKKFARANGQDFMTLKAVNKEHASLMNVPIGTEVKAIHVIYVFDAGTPEQTESSLIFNFAKVDGQYKFVSLMQAG